LKGQLEEMHKSLTAQHKALRPKGFSLAGTNAEGDLRDAIAMLQERVIRLKNELAPEIGSLQNLAVNGVNLGAAQESQARLAGSLACVGPRTLISDGDMRKPCV
jgi:hypothetical protein